ncbi:MAG TPA: hypothetical protein ENK31_01500, partial [Nannocystis exedens]|nr:hypothetical protein [Nannocystis exedens]
EALPPATEGKSQIPPRPPSISRQLKALEMRTAWAELIDLGERLLARHRLDLDLQRTTATALLSLDPPAEAAADAIRTRTVELLRRFPGLLDLRSSDGAALADSDTRAWLRAEHNMCNPSARHSILPNSEHAHTSESASEHSHRSDSRHNSIQTDSHNSALKGDASQNQGQSGLFIDRLQLAERALLNGNTTFAAALFAGLETMVDLYQLDRWRPDLAERVLLGTLRTQASTATVSSREKRLGSICPQALADFLRTAAKSS